MSEKHVKLCIYCWDCEALKRKPEFAGVVIHETICETHLREQEQIGHITLSLLEPVDLMD